MAGPASIISLRSMPYRVWGHESATFPPLHRYPEHITAEASIMLGNLLGGGRGGMSPITMALVGLLAYRTMKGKGRLAEMLGRKPADGAPPGANPYGGNAGAPDPGSAGGGGIGGLLGGLFGGGTAGLLSGGLRDLLQQFQQNGQGGKAQSWVARGPNEPLSPTELEHTLGEDKIAWLMQETGLSRDDLLNGLSRELPDAVDQLTPDGRLPEAKG
jgi:uncharacterized protein YidB (DUF937 family)